MAVIYVRLSEDKHKGTADEGVGVARQEAECRALAERLGLAVTHVYRDNDLSATTGVRRPEFEQMLADRPDIVICWHQDRLLRVSRDLEKVLEAKAVVHTVTGGSLDLSTPTGQALARTVAAWSTFEGEQKRLRQQAQHRQRRSMGIAWWSVRPFGWEKDGTLHPVESQAIRDAYADVLHGGSVTTVMRSLNAAGLYPPRTGKPWQHTGARNLLLNIRNIGLLVHDGDEVKGQWEPVIDDVTFYRAKALLTAGGKGGGGAGRTHGRVYPYSGLFECGVCHGPMYGCHRTDGPGKVVDAYRCREGHVSIAWHALEDTLRVEMVEFALQDGTRAPRIPGLDAESRARLTARRDQVKTTMDDLAQAIVRGMPVRIVQKAAAGLQEEIDRLDAELSKAPEIRFRTIGEVTEAAMSRDFISRFRIVVNKREVDPRVTIQPT